MGSVMEGALKKEPWHKRDVSEHVHHGGLAGTCYSN